jgi:DNA polymerase-3 subunit delta
MTKEKEGLHPVTFFYGPEDYLIDEEVQDLLNQTLPRRERELNFHLFRGEEASVPELIQTAKTLPMFSRFRVIVLHDADHIEKEELEPLLEYIRDPCPATRLILWGRTLGPWAKYTDDLEKAGRVKEHRRLKGKALVFWLVRRMEEMGKKLSEDAAGYIVEVVGDHLQDLQRSLEKAFLGVGEKQSVKLSDVEGFISEVKASTVFDLMDAIGERNLEQALGILEKAMESKTIPFRKEEETSKKMDDPVPLLLSMMAKQYRNIWRVKEIASKGREITEAARELRMPPWNVRKLLAQAEHFSESSLRQGILKCHRTDLRIKRGRSQKDLLMEKLVIDLCRPMNPSSRP